MRLEFKKLTIDDKELFDGFLSRNDTDLGWEYDFATTLCWGALFKKTCFAVLDGILLIKTVFYNDTVFYPPIVKNPADFNKAINIIKEYCKDEKIKLDIRGLTKERADILDKALFNAAGDRDKADYIYNASDLISLTGKKYHSKRNFVKRFLTKYNYAFGEYDPLVHKDGVVSLFDNWLNENSAVESDRSEAPVFSYALENYRELSLKIGVLTVEGKVVAFSINSVKEPLVAHTLIEKGDISFEGVYQAVNFLTANTFFKNVKYVNRQEDMGLEGLRKSKLSYYPAMLLEKYRITEK